MKTQKNDNTTTKDTETKKDNNTVNDNNKLDTNKDVSKIDKDKLILQDNQNTNSNSNIKIEDRQKGNCAQAIEYYYQDNVYKYYFTCIKSNSVFVIKDGKEYTIKYALNNNIVTMQELIDNGFHPLKESHNLVDK